MAACSQADRRQPGDTGRDPCGATEIEDDAGECVPAACGRAATGDVSDADVILAPGDDVQAAVDALGSGTVALTAGTYDAQLSLGAEADGIHIAGRCPELVTIDGSKWTNGQPVIAIGENAHDVFELSGIAVTGGSAGGLVTGKSSLRLEHMVFSDNALGGLTATANATVSMSDVIIRGGTVIGLDVDGATVSADGLTVSGIHAEVPDTAANAVVVSGRSVATLSHALITDNEWMGMVVDGPNASLVLDDVTISGTSDSGYESVSANLLLQNGATAEGTDLSVLDSPFAGVAMNGGSAHIAGLTATCAPGGLLNTPCFPVTIASGATATLEDVTATGGRPGALYAGGAGTTLSVSGCTLSDATSEDGVQQAAAVYIEDGASASIDDCDVRSTLGIGVGVIGAGSTLNVTDVRVSAVRPAADGVTASNAFEAADGATLTATRIDASDVVGNALVVGTGAHAIIDGLSVSGVGAREGGFDGFGLAIRTGADAVVTDVDISDTGRQGIFLQEGGTAVVTDCTLDRTGATVVAEFATAVWVETGSMLDLHDCVITRAVSGGVLASGYGTVLHTTNVDVSDVAAPGGASAAVEVYTGAHLIAEDLRLDGTHGYGVMVMGGGAVAELHDTEVSRNGLDNLGFAAAVVAGQAGAIYAKSLSVHDVSGIGVYAYGEGSAAEIDGLDVNGVAIVPAEAGGLGVTAATGGELRLSNATIHGVEGPGLAVFPYSELECTDCFVTDNAFAGVWSAGGSLSLDRVTVERTLPDPSGGGGCGLFASASATASHIDIRESDILDNPLAAVWIGGGRDVHIADSRLSAGDGVEIRPGLRLHGNAIFARAIRATEDDPGLVVENTATAAGGDCSVLLDNASAAFAGMAWSGEGTDVVQQACEGADPPSGIDEAMAEICPESDRATLTLTYSEGLDEPTGHSE